MNNLIFIIFCFLLFYLPLDFGGHCFRSQVLFIVFVFLSACLYMLFSKKFLGVLKQFLYPALLMLAALIASLFVSSYAYPSLMQSLLFAAYFLVFVIAANAFGNVGNRHAYSLQDKFPAVLAAAATTVALVGFYFYKITNEAGFVSDFYSTFYQKNICAGFLVIVLPVLLSLYLTQSRLLWSALFGAGAYFSLLGLLFTQSRLGWVIFLIIFVFLLINLYRYHLSKKKFLIKLAALFLLLAVSVTLFSIKPGQQGRQAPAFLKEKAKSIIETADTSKLARLEFFRIALKEFADHPVTGVGLQNFAYYYPKYQKDPRFYSKFVHSFYLETLCELGILGFAALCAVLFLLLRGYFRAVKLSRNTRYYPLILGLSLGCISSLLHIAADVDWLFASIPFYFFFFSGVIFYYLNFLEDNEGCTDAVYRVCMPIYRYAGIAALMALSVVLLIFHMAEISAVTGKYYKEKNMIAEAAANYEKAVRLNPLNADYHKQLAGLYFQMNINNPVVTGRDLSLQNAINYAQSAIRLERLKPNNYILLANLYKVGACHGMPLQEKLYAETLEAALRVDSINYPSVYNDLASYYLEKGNTSEAEKIITKVISMYKDEYFDVMPDFRREELKKQISDSYVILASANALKNNNALAEKLFLRALELCRENILANFALGMIYYNSKEYSNAVKYLRRVLKAYENMPAQDEVINRVNEALKECEKRGKKRLGH